MTYEKLGRLRITSEAGMKKRRRKKSVFILVDGTPFQKKTFMTNLSKMYK